MRHSLILLLAGFCCAATAFADDHLRDVQTELKSQGFYYGEVDGRPSDQLTAAVRRYQIRNGLEVSGEVNPEVLQSLGLAAAPPAQPAQPPAAPAAPPAPAVAQDRPAPAQPPLNLRRDDSVADSDRRALREEAGREELPHRPNAGPPGVPNQPSEIYRGVFAGTPYQIAPQVVQEDTFRRAQHLLAARGFIREAPDERPGPQTEEAVLAYQRSTGLPLTGRLDMQTLSVMRLLPGRGEGNPALPPAGPGRVARPLPYKGIWVQ